MNGAGGDVRKQCLLHSCSRETAGSPKRRLRAKTLDDFRPTSWHVSSNPKDEKVSPLVLLFHLALISCQTWGKAKEALGIFSFEISVLSWTISRWLQRKLAWSELPAVFSLRSGLEMTESFKTILPSCFNPRFLFLV